MAGESHQKKPISLFYSYSHRDEVLRDKLDAHLAFLRRSERITEWHDRKIGAGKDWSGQIDRRLAEADIILLLVSADFIASDYCWREEMTKALERHRLREARVIPVILHPCQWQQTPLGSLQAVPKDGKPISEWPSHDAALDDIAAAVESTVADLQPIEPQEVAPLPRPIDPLPPLPQRFIGRVNERASLIKTLTNEPRLPAVVLGGPGMGKSTLCVKVINQEDVKKAYNRIYYVRLDSIRTTDAMIAKLRDNLGLIASRSAFKQVIGELEHCSSLLFLDNFEDYWWSKPEEAEDILSHLAQIQQSTFVITLRGIESPLGPKWGARIDLPPLSYDESRILFASTSEKDEHFMDPNALDEIIRSMDGIPLAIVLMGRRAQTDPLPQLARQWTKKRTEILRYGKSPDRVTSLDVSVNVSLGDPRMDKEAMRLLQILGILPTGLEFDDLEAILPDTGIDSKHTLLATGIAIRREIMPGTAMERLEGIRLLSPVRCYIEDHHPPDVMDSRRTFIYFLNLAEQATKIGWEDGQNVEEILSRKSASIDYLLQKQLSFHNRDDALYAVRVAIAYGRYQRFAGVGTYGLLEQAAEVSQRFNEKSLQASCHLALGSMKVMRSLPAAAKIDFEKAKTLYMTQEDIFGIAHCLRGLGYVELVTFNYAAAKTLYEDAKRKYESVRDKGVDQKSWALGNDVEQRKREIERGIADCIFRIGTIIQDSTLRHEEADDLYKRAFHIHERIGDVLGHAHCLKRLADVAMSKYFGDDAEQLYKNANELYRKVPYLVGMADCAYSIGDLFFRRGEIDVAEAYYADASHLYTRASSDHGKVNCLYSQADIDLCHIFGAPEICENDWKRLYDIERKYQRARSSYETLHDGIGIANCDSGLSDIKHLQGDEAAAENLLGLVHELVRECFNKDEDVLPAMALENGRLRRWRS